MSDEEATDAAEARALELLRACTTPHGFVAAADPVRNYGRIWSRDGVICGLGALVSGEADLVDAFEATLRTLGAHQGRGGQLPSNVDHDACQVSYGMKAGRVDATLWFIVGLCLIGRLGGRDALVRQLWPVLRRALDVVRAWEFNGRGLIYVPRAGDWADEYDLHGYVLYDQALRLWAWREAAAAARRLSAAEEAEAAELEAEAAVIAQRIDHDFWPTAAQREALYDPSLARCIRPERAHFVAAFEPGGVEDRFDALGNALCCLLQPGSGSQRRLICEHASSLVRHGLIPAFDPVIEPSDPRYAILRATRAPDLAEELNELPGRYHNGGLWPMVNGFWALAAAASARDDLAARLAAGIIAAVSLEGWSFCEYVDARTGQAAGVRRQAWSAAGLLLAVKRDRGAALFAP